MKGQPRSRAIVQGDEAFGFEMVGESHYQDALENIVGGRCEDSAKCYCAALLSPERDNKHDRDAVAVTIRGHKVGYLSREDAPSFNAALRAVGLQEAVCAAIIVGGWQRGSDRGHFGVKLDMSWPILFRDE